MQEQGGSVKYLLLRLIFSSLKGESFAKIILAGSKLRNSFLDDSEVLLVVVPEGMIGKVDQ